MYLKSLFLRNFRNYTDAQIHFGPRINVIAGENAQGKTNLLEALYLLSCGRSFRTPHLSELIQKGKAFFYLEAHLEKNGITETLKLHFDGKTKKFQYNSTLYLSFNSLLGVMPQVLHAPSDLDLIASVPSVRRRFLNIHLAQHDPMYVHHLLRYYKAMKQRNFLLKSRRVEGIECWEEEMALSANYLIAARAKMIEEVQKRLFPLAEKLLLPQDLEIQYVSSADPKALWQKHRQKELSYGATLFGPHRDDFQIILDKLPARSFASEGQKEALSFALRLAEWERLCEKTELPVLMSIDDFGVHLDEKRLALLQESLQRFLQVFLTTPREFPDLPYSKGFIIEKGEPREKGKMAGTIG